LVPIGSLAAFDGILDIARCGRVAVVQWLGLNIFLADHLGGGAKTLHPRGEVRDVQEARLLEPDIHECRLHPGQHARDLALVKIADEPLALLAFEMELGKNAVFEHRHPHFERRCIDYDFAFHRSDLPDGPEGTINADEQRIIQPGPGRWWSRSEVVAFDNISRGSLLRVYRILLI
jgi:hypothetical protein